jgi:hypothetical protein
VSQSFGFPIPGSRILGLSLRRAGRIAAALLLMAIPIGLGVPLIAVVALGVAALALSYFVAFRESSSVSQLFMKYRRRRVESIDVHGPVLSVGHHYVACYLVNESEPSLEGRSEGDWADLIRWSAAQSMEPGGRFVICSSVLPECLVSRRDGIPGAFAVRTRLLVSGKNAAEIGTPPAVSQAITLKAIRAPKALLEAAFGNLCNLGYLAERPTGLKSDTFVACVLEVASFPTSGSEPDGLAELLSACPPARLVALVGEPLDSAASARLLARAETEHLADTQLRSERNYLIKGKDRRAIEGLKHLESELAHGEYLIRYQFYVVVLAPNETDLGTQVTSARQMASRAGMTLRFARLRQREIFEILTMGVTGWS